MARPRPPAVVVARAPNERLWGVFGEEGPPHADGRPRDPYLEQGCHPDVVERVWDQLGAEVPPGCRGQASGVPVLVHPDTGRVFAFARGTAYALWLVPADADAAATAGLGPAHRWGGGTVTDLAAIAGPGWIWGRYHRDEPAWVRRAYEAGGPG